jgi:hypothetical protein
MPGASSQLGTGQTRNSDMDEISHRTGARKRLPNRRGAIAFELKHAGHRFRAHVGCFSNGSPGELFLDAAKQNSGLDALAADAAILISLLLQHGSTATAIGHALRRSPNGMAASLIGAAVDRLSALEKAP